MESKELAIRLARALDAKKGYNIRILHVENLTTVTDYFVIATGNSTTHVGALADEADFQLGRAGVNVLRTEGHDGNRWVLLDYGSVIVHVFTPEAHDFYDLEHLWADAKELPRQRMGRKAGRAGVNHGCWMAPLEGSRHRRCLRGGTPKEHKIQGCVLPNHPSPVGAGAPLQGSRCGAQKHSTHKFLWGEKLYEI